MASPDGGFSDDAGDIGPSVDTGPRPDLGPLVPDLGSVDLGPSDPLTVFEEEAQVSGLRTYVHIRGTTTSTLPPVVLMGTGLNMGGIAAFFGAIGFGLGSEYLTPYMDFMADDRLMIYFDLEATGRSGVGTSSVSVEGHTEHLTNLVTWLEDQQGLNMSELDLVGHGYGGGVAAMYAAQAPQRVRKLLLITPMATNIQQYTDAITNHLSRLSEADRMIIDLISRQPECRGNPRMCSLEIWRLFGPLTMCRDNRELFMDIGFEYTDTRSFNQVRLNLQNSQYDWAPMLSNIAVPTTIISGDCDAAPPAIAQTYANTIPAARHVILDNTGHFPMVERANEFQVEAKRALSGP